MYCSHLTLKKLPCKNKKKNGNYCALHAKLQKPINWLYLFTTLIEIFDNELYLYKNLWRCNNDLYNRYIEQSPTYQYFKGNILNIMPNLYSDIPPDSIISTIRNTMYCLIICHPAKEYMVCTYSQVLPLLEDITERWDKINVYPYINNCLLYYNISEYNFAIIDYQIQKYNITFGIHYV